MAHHLLAVTLHAEFVKVDGIHATYQNSSVSPMQPPMAWLIKRAVQTFKPCWYEEVVRDYCKRCLTCMQNS